MPLLLPSFPERDNFIHQIYKTCPRTNIPTHIHTYCSTPVHMCRQMDASTNMQLWPRFCSLLASFLQNDRHGSITCRFSASLLVPVLFPMELTLEKIRSPSPTTSTSQMSNFELQDFPINSLSNSIEIEWNSAKNNRKLLIGFSYSCK